MPHISISCFQFPSQHEHATTLQIIIVDDAHLQPSVTRVSVEVQLTLVPFAVLIPSYEVKLMPAASQSPSSTHASFKVTSSLPMLLIQHVLHLFLAATSIILPSSNVPVSRLPHVIAISFFFPAPLSEAEVIVSPFTFVLSLPTAYDSSIIVPASPFQLITVFSFMPPREVSALLTRFIVVSFSIPLQPISFTLPAVFFTTIVLTVALFVLVAPFPPALISRVPIAFYVAPLHPPLVGLSLQPTSSFALIIQQLAFQLRALPSFPLSVVEAMPIIFIVFLFLIESGAISTVELFPMLIAVPSTLSLSL